MFAQTAPFHRHAWPMKDWRVWLVAVLLLGMLLSSLGHTSSHGIAAIAGVQHGQNTDHGHSHDDEPDGPLTTSDASHAHHNSADHSHDKAHALPLKLSIHLPEAPIWRPLTHPLDAGWVVFRLDRPPMA